MRIFTIDPIADWSVNEVKLAEPFHGEAVLSGRLEAMQEWTDLHCEGQYIILLGVVVFEREADAIIFKLKYG